MPIRQDITTQGSTRGTTDSYADNLDVDVLIVGAGFGGVYLLKKFRDMGLKTKILEAGTDLGGIWHWNCYPGARVDSEIPVYEYSQPEIWKTWSWSCKYPGFGELRKYFDHVDKVWDVKKDVAFNSRVVGAQFDEATTKWKVNTEDGRTATSRYFILATGFAAKRHFPDWKGIHDFKGEMHHSSFWPDSGVNVKGKRVAVIGTGSTGIQISQELGKEAAEMTAFVRTPNLCLPMRQHDVTVEEQAKTRDQYPEFFKHRLTTFAGFPYDFVDKNTTEVSAEEREALYEELWQKGGFNFWLANYKDYLFNEEANQHVYDFWAKKTRARITDPVKRDILAPLEKRHAWGTKRPSLEQDYYEIMDQEKVKIIDVNQNGIREFTEKGIITEDGKLHELDFIALATGFDSNTGGMKNMGLKDKNGVDLRDHWNNGTYSYLGMTLRGYPNMFFLYGAQGEYRLPNHTARHFRSPQQSHIPLSCFN